MHFDYFFALATQLRIRLVTGRRGVDRGLHRFARITFPDFDPSAGLRRGRGLEPLRALGTYSDALGLGVKIPQKPSIYRAKTPLLSVNVLRKTRSAFYDTVQSNWTVLLIGCAA